MKRFYVWFTAEDGYSGPCSRSFQTLEEAEEIARVLRAMAGFPRVWVSSSDRPSSGQVARA